MDKIGVSYFSNTTNTTNFVKVINVVSVTNEVIQIIHVEICEWGYVIQRVCIRPYRKMFNISL